MTRRGNVVFTSQAVHLDKQSWARCRLGANKDHHAKQSDELYLEVQASLFAKAGGHPAEGS